MKEKFIVTIILKKKKKLNDEYIRRIDRKIRIMRKKKFAVVLSKKLLLYCKL